MRISPLLLSLAIVSFASDAFAQFPDFLPSYYLEALRYEQQPLVLTSKTEKDGVKRTVFEKLGQPVGVAIEQMACERPQCTALLENHLKQLSERITLNGTFQSVSPSEYLATWTEDSRSFLLYFAKLPASVEVWTRVSKTTSQWAEEPFVSNVRKALNRHRYEDAKQRGNVDVGVWSKEIALHARDLREAQKNDEALGVLTQLIAWAPYNFEAHLDFAEMTKDAKAARASALAVWDNAEDEQLRVRAGKLIARDEPKLESIPVLEPGLKGLQIVLIPVSPCDLRLVEEAARLFSSSFDLPVKIARLPVNVTWHTPERLFRERDMRGTIAQKSGSSIDFRGWSKERYASELTKVTEKDDPLTRYWIADFLKSVSDKPGQYKIDHPLAQLGDLLKPFRADDRRTIFVGVTGQDIFAGDTNYVFSTTAANQGKFVSLLSYARMQSWMTGEPFQSRKRVAQRLAKEMVPAALKQLEIARPADPSDPYSYSDGLDRLDQKSLILSTSTRDALDQFRKP